MVMTEPICIGCLEDTGTPCDAPMHDGPNGRPRLGRELFSCPRCGKDSPSENTFCYACAMEGLQKFGWIK